MRTLSQFIFFLLAGGGQPKKEKRTVRAEKRMSYQEASWFYSEGTPGKPLQSQRHLEWSKCGDENERH